MVKKKLIYNLQKVKTFCVKKSDKQNHMVLVIRSFPFAPEQVTEAAVERESHCNQLLQSIK